MRAMRCLAVFAAVLTAAVVTAPASAKCLARSLGGANGSSANITVVVPDSGGHAPQSPGYKEVSCSGIDKQAYRSQMCNPASFRSSGIRRQVEIQAGASIAQLCLAARAEAGLSEVLPEEFFRQLQRQDPGTVKPDPSSPIVERPVPGSKVAP